MAYSKYFVPQIWTSKIMRTLEDNLVARKICNTSYEGELKKAGDTVHFNGLGEPTVNTYAGTVSYETLNDTRISLLIDQQKYFAFKVGDIEKAQANVDMKGSQAERAAYQLKKVADSFVLGKYADALAANKIEGDAGAAIEITTANVLSNVSKLAQKLLEQNVDQKDISLVIPPWLKLKLELAGIKFQINNGINGTGGMAWTDQLGFNTYVTNNLVGTNAAGHRIIACSPNAIVYADQIVDTEDLRLESSFDSAVRGLHVYGAKVIKPEELAYAFFKEGAETTI
jgi:hypothetical protein